MFDCSYRNGLFFATIHLLNFHLFPDFFEDVFLVALLILLLMLHCQSKLWDLHKKMWGDQGDLTFCLIIKSSHCRENFRRQKLNQKMFSIGGGLMNETKILSFHWFGFFIVIGNWFIAKEMTIFGSIYLYRNNKNFTTNHPVSDAGIRTHDLFNTSCLTKPLDQASAQSG